MKFHALICARAGSKGIKNKNIRQFKKKPLISYPIKLAKNIKRIESVSVSTDSRKIANISKNYGADIPFIRSKRLSSNKANEWDVWKDFVEKKNFKSKDDIIVILPVTSPFRIKKDVEKCITLYKKKKFDYVIVVAKASHNPHFNMVRKKQKNLVEICMPLKSRIVRRQDAPKIYNITTICFVVSAKYIMSKKSGQHSTLKSGKVGAVEIPYERSLDLDTEFDLKVAKLLSN
jgi:N-acylneuraminate cytidylyltransferase|tara:strand:- start:1592 stop:2287 length:696 start_codon:yes stop_codon:yes gene_type:complete